MNKLVQQIIKSKVYEVLSPTPLELANGLSNSLSCNVYMKREDLLQVKSFKLRGAYNKIAQLSESELSKGVLAASAGNHAQGVALSAQRLGVKATIVMPTTTPQIKIDAVKGYGAEVVLVGDSFSDASDYAMKLLSETGMTFIHPFDDELVIAGQGTIGKEIYEQLPEVDYVFVPVGGGGLVAGIATYLKFLNPNIKIIGVEPDENDAMRRSINAGKRVYLDEVGIFADGVAVKLVGENTFKLVQKHVDEMITVSTDQLCTAIKDVYQEIRVILEPAGALSVAGVKEYAKTHDLKGKNIVTINCGANMSFEKLRFVAERTLLGSGKESLYSIQLPEEKGALLTLVKHVMRGNTITEFNYRKSDASKAEIFVGILSTTEEDKTNLEKKLKVNNYQFVDMTHDEIAKEHVRHMIGGKLPSGSKEHIYKAIFPERPKALNDFLESLNNRFNISLFHFRSIGDDTANVLVGLEGEGEINDVNLPKNFTIQKIDSTAVELFL